MSKAVKILSLTFIALAFSANVGAATLKIATLAPAGTNWMKQMKAGAKVIKERTDGRVKFKFYPGGVMGNDRSVHRKIKIGQLQGGTFTPGSLGQINPVIYGLGLPMMFNTYEEVDYVRARMDPVIKQAMEESGMVILGLSEGGFARIMSKEPMLDLESIRASKAWIPEGDELAKITYDALGINAVALPMVGTDQSDGSQDLL